VFAIVETGGFQYRAEKGTVLSVPKIEAEVGSTVHLDRVLLYADGHDLRVGTPTVAGVTGRAEVVAHGKGDKVIVFKFRKRESYKRTKGHRQQFTRVRVTEISAG
jgi:large subunit ribosomal protein L21